MPATLFEREIGTTASSLGFSENDTRDALKAYRNAAARLAREFTASETARTARALATYLLPSKPMTDQLAASVAKVFVAIQAIDKEEGTARTSDMASITSDAVMLAQAKRRAGLGLTFTLDDAAVSRLRGLVA